MKKIFLFIIVAVLISFTSVTMCFYIFPEYTFSKIMEFQRERAGLKLITIDVSGNKIKYLQGGEGEDLVLLHGFGANKDNWTSVSKYLSGHFRITAPDLTGFGESDKPFDADYSIEAQMERCMNFINAAGIKSFHLGGNSMGGYISALLAAQYGDRVKSLLLISPGGVISSPDSEMITLLKNGENPLIASNLESYKALYDFVFYKKPFIPEPFTKFLAKRAATESRLNRKIFMDILLKPVPVEKALDGSEIPTLIIWGREDRVLHWRGGEIIKNKMVNAKNVTFEKTGHLPMIEKPEKTANAFLLFHRRTN